jgi:hypothetical protein
LMDEKYMRAKKIIKKAQEKEKEEEEEDED